jgi:hypothetical protein
MDAVIDYDEAAGFLKKNALEPRLEFTNFRALKKHVIQALSQLYCPQSAIDGWASLAMDPATYQLLKGTAFVMPVNPGLTAINPQWVVLTTVKMIDATFLCNKNYFLSYKNITRACFGMFDKNIGVQSKVSNTSSDGVELHHVHH